MFRIGRIARIDKRKTVGCGIFLTSVCLRESAESGVKSLATTRPFAPRHRRIDAGSFCNPFTKKLSLMLYPDLVGFRFSIAFLHYDLFSNAARTGITLRRINV